MAATEKTRRPNSCQKKSKLKIIIKPTEKEPKRLLRSFWTLPSYFCCIFLNTTTSIDSHPLQISQDDVFVVILIKNLHSCGLLWRTAGRSQFNSIVLLKQLFHVSPSPRHGAQGAVSVAIIELETRRGDYPSPVVILRRQRIREFYLFV